MTKEELYKHEGWKWCTPQGSVDQVLLMGLKTTFREKIEDLESMEDLSLLFKKNRESNSNKATNGHE